MLIKTPLLLSITLLFTIICLTANAQNILNKRISIDFKNITLKKAINKIERKANLNFTYNPKKVLVHQRVILKAENETLKSILEKLFIPLRIDYKIFNTSDILLIYNPNLKGKPLSEKLPLTLLKGQVLDRNGVPLVGTTVAIQNTVDGTITDIDGRFSVEIDGLPVVLQVSHTGYGSVSLEVNETNLLSLNIVMVQSSFTLDQVLIEATRNSARNIKVPFTIEKLDGLAIQSSSAESPIAALTNLRGVQVFKGSLSGNVLNARGFSSMANQRFLMHLDGMDVASPSFGFYANLSGTTSLDMQSVEIIPSASSALYGPNAFNGILLMKSKDPFLYQGLSVELKSGITYQNAGGINPYNNLSFRFAKAYNNKWAIKVDYETLYTNDWIANDYTVRNFDRNPLILPDETPILTSPDMASYDAWNISGDSEAGTLTEVFSDQTSSVTTSNGISYPWTLGTLSRTGYKEEELFDNAISNHRINAGLYYKINNDFTLEGLVKYGSYDLVHRHATYNPITNLTLQQQKLELRGKGLTVRAYTHFQNPKEASVSLYTATSIQRQLLSNEDWGQRFVDAYFGEANEVPTSSIAAARAYADAGMAPVGSLEFNQARRKALENTYTYSSDGLIGSKFFDKSWLWHTDLNYDFSEIITDPSWNISLGGSFRSYTIRSQGTYFSDNKDELYESLGYPNIGYEGNILVSQTAVFGQINKKLLEDQINLSVSARLNGHSIYKPNFTPQISAVFSPDPNRNHNLRASFTTGVRNPGLEEQFKSLIISPNGFILGGLDENLDHFVDPINHLTGDDIRDAFKEQLGYEHQSLQPERNSTYELGYKGLLAKDKLLVDINAYYTTYEDFIERTVLLIASPTTGDFLFAGIYSNLEDKINTRGLGIGLEYALGETYRLYSNYQFSDFNFSSTNESVAVFGFIPPAFNAPKNNFNFGISKRNKTKGFGFDIAARYASQWTFISIMGKGFIPSFFTIDASISYKYKNFNFTLGASNLNRNEYRTMIGGPAIGSLYTVKVLYDMKFQP